jgi:nitrite reductase (NADH) small subunit
VVAFEGDSSAAFLDLVMDLRETGASLYTLRDTPTFSCINMTLAETLDSIGGAPVAEIAGPDLAARDGWVQAIRLADLPPGGSAKVYLGSQQVALFNVDGRLYAVNNRCPHARGPLCEGRVETDSRGGPSVVCPWHDAAFDLTSGEALHGPVRTPVQAYQARAGEDGYVYIAETSWVESQAGATN